MKPYKQNVRKLGLVTDDYVNTFMGSEYKIEGDVRTIGELRSMLEGILKDLPEDDSLELAELLCCDGKLSYLLKEGIIASQK